MAAEKKNVGAPPPSLLSHPIIYIFLVLPPTHTYPEKQKRNPPPPSPPIKSTQNQKYSTYIPQNLRIPPMRRRRHLRQHTITSLTSILTLILVRGRGLRVQDKRDGEEAFDPFDELVPAVRLEGVFDPVAGRHCLVLDRSGLG